MSAAHPGPDLPESAPHIAERGFTLIELLVVMALSTLVVGVIAGGLLRGLSGSNDAEVQRRAIAEFDHARQMLEHDLRAARAPGRDYDLITNRRDLRDAVLTGTSALPASLDIRDIKVATATRLVFVADVEHPVASAAPLPECVQWQVRSGSGTWWLERSVATYTAACGGFGTGSYVIKPQTISAASPVPTQLLSYVRTCDASLCGAGTCSGSPPVASVTGTGRNWITEVRLDLTTLLTRRSEAARGKLLSSVAIRNRTSDDYMFALGCLEQT